MKPSRFSPWHVHTAGLVACLIIFLFLFFAMIRPKTQDTDLQQQAADAAEKGGGTDQDIASSAAEIKKQKKLTEGINADWAVWSHKYMPELPFKNSNLLEVFYETNSPVNDLPAKWGRWVTNWYDAQKKDGVFRQPGVDFPIPSLATEPNGIAELNTITLPSAKSPWKVSLTCQTFDDAMAHLRRFNSMEAHGMPVIDSVTLSGHSPELTLSYNLSLYIIPGQNPPPPDARIGAGTGGGGGGAMGGMGGMGGGGMGGGGTKPMTPGGAKGAK